MPQRPNIVMICVDQWRWDCLSIAGHPAVETPHLDFLASRGVRFTNAHTAVASCIAARVALFTGQSQRTHGRVGYCDCIPWDYPVNLAGQFTQGGYQTVAIGKMHVYPQRHNMGFEQVVLHDGMVHAYGKDNSSDYESWLKARMGPDVDFFGHGMEANSWVARPWHLPEDTHPTYWTTTQATQFLQTRDQGRPFFLFLSYVAPHAPLVPPPFYLDMYMRKDLPCPPMGDWVSKFPMPDDPWDHHTSHGKLSADAQKRAQAGYYGLCTQIDHQIGRLMEHMLKHHIADNTIFIFVSDHGELLGDHNLFRKTVPYAGSIRVPLLISSPWGKRIPTGVVSNQLVELRDLMPTALDLAGLPTPSTVEGVSLTAAMTDQAAPIRSHLHGEHSWRFSTHYINDGRFKYIWYSRDGMEQLFDTLSDPNDLHDLIDLPQHKATASRLRDLLVQELTGRQEGYSDGKQLIVGKSPVALLSHVKRT